MKKEGKKEGGRMDGRQAGSLARGSWVWNKDSVGRPWFLICIMMVAWACLVALNGILKQSIEAALAALISTLQSLPHCRIP